MQNSNYPHPTPKKEKSPFNLEAGKQSNRCESAVVGMGVGSLLVVPSAVAAVSAPASRCNGLKDMGEEKLFPRGKNSVASRSKDEECGKLPAGSL